MTPKAEPKTRNRRTADQIVADLQAKIESVRARAASRAAKSTDEGSALLLAVRTLDKATRIATEAQNDVLVRALEASRAPLSEQLVSLGIRLPDPKAKRGRPRRSA